MKRLALLVVVAFGLSGCPKNTPINVAGSDDEQMDQLGAQLEELRTKTDLSCSDWCSLKGRVCGLSQSICDISGKKTDRPDFQKKCVQSQEDCARFNDSCSSCAK